MCEDVSKVVIRCVILFGRVRKSNNLLAESTLSDSGVEGVHADMAGGQFALGRSLEVAGREDALRLLLWW